MRKIETGILSNHIRACAVYRRYMVETIFVIDDSKRFGALPKHSHHAFENIQLTLEMEFIRAPPFIDVLTCRGPCRPLQFNIHRKANWSREYKKIKTDLLVDSV